jgi:FkbM family methyltransferase
MNNFLQKLSQLMAQAIVDRASSSSSTKWRFILSTKIAKYTRSLLVKYKDPLIKFKIQGIELQANLSHELPFILNYYPYYSSNLGRVSSYISTKYSDLKIIDVGANIGDSVAILRSYVDSSILCVEAHPLFLELLIKNTNQFKDISIAVSYLGDRSETCSMQFEDLGGTAHLSVTTNLINPNQNQVSIITLDDLLGNYPSFLKTKMMKIDTDGFDGKIIRGSKKILQCSKPVVFFEYDPYFLNQQGDDGISIFHTLKEIGYAGVIIYDNFGRLLLTLPSIDFDRLQEIHSYFSNRNSHLYCDICIFHAEDQDLYEVTRKKELVFFQKSIHV